MQLKRDPLFDAEFPDLFDIALEGLPNLQKEQPEARRKENEERQVAMRRLRPPLREVLEPVQADIEMRGTDDQRAALFASLDRDTLEKVALALPPNVLAAQPELRRMANVLRQPRQVVIDDLRLEVRRPRT